MSYFTIIFLFVKCMTESTTSWWWIIPFVLLDVVHGWWKLARWAMDKDIEKLIGKK